MRANLAAKIHRTEQVVAIADDIARIRARLEPSSPDKSGPPEAVWIAYGDEPLLITVTPASPPVPSLVLAVVVAFGYRSGYAAGAGFMVARQRTAASSWVKDLEGECGVAAEP